MSNKLNKLINKKLFRRLLKEQEKDMSDVDMSDYTSMGFKDVASNKKAIQMEDPLSQNNKELFKNSKIAPVENESYTYYVLKGFYKELVKTHKLGASKKDLGLSSKIEGTRGDDGTCTYKKLGDNEYQIVSGPIPENIGRVFKTKYEFTDEQLAKLPDDLNREKGDMFRQWVSENKTEDEVKEAFKELPSTDKSLGESGSFTNDHFKLAYITFKDEYDKHLKRFDTDNAPAFMGLKKAETGEGVEKDYYKFVIDDVAVAIDTDGNILQRPRGKGGSYVNEQKARIINRYKLLRERRLDVSYIVGKIQKGIDSGNIKGMKEIPQGLKDIVQKKAGTTKPSSKTSKPTSKKSKKVVSSSGSLQSERIPYKYDKNNPAMSVGYKLGIRKGKKGISNISSDPITKQAISDAVRIEKVPEWIMNSMAAVESGGNSQVGKNKFGYTGLYQFGKSAANGVGFEYEELDGGDQESVTNNAIAGARFMKNNAKRAGEAHLFAIYMSHQQGSGGYKKLLQKKDSTEPLIRNQRTNIADSVAKRINPGGKDALVQADFFNFWLGMSLGLEAAALGGSESGSPGERKNKGKPLPYVYIADSQGRSGLGLAIRKRLGNTQDGVNFFQKNGATPSAIMSEFGDSINDAVSNTENIIFTLGGNGSSKASFLARDVLLNAPESAQITWILAPPAVKPTSKTTYVNTPGKPSRQVNTFKATRARYNKDIVDGIRAVESRLGMSGRINIVDPYPWFEQNVSSSNDGVHVDKKPGEEYVATIQSEIMPKQKAMAENTYKTRKNKMIIAESQLRRLISNILLENKTEDIKFIQKTIDAKDDGIWGEKTDEKWVAWVDKNIDSLIKASGGGIKKEKALKFKKNAAQLAALILNDPSKKSIAGVAEMIKLAQDPESIKNKQAAEKKSKNLSTGGNYKFLKGSNPDGTYPAKPDRGLTKPYLKFVKDEQVFALDPNEPDPEKALKQAERGAGKKVNFVSESQKALFERVLKRRIVENYVNPAKVYMDLKKGRVDDPGGVFEKNKEKIEKIATAGVAKSKTDSSKSVDPKEHTFINEDNLPIRFKQIDMSSGAAEAEKILSAVGGTSHKTEAGAKKIVNLVLKPAVERFGKTSSALYYDRKGVSLSDAWKYIGTSETGKQRTAWSGHTLNSFIAPGHPFFDGNKSLGTLGISYFWPWLIEKRKEVESDPESYIGQKIMMPFSKEEIDSRSDIEIKDGVFSLNGRGGVPKGAGLKGFKAKSKKGAVSGAHMNVYSGGKLIGGNLSGTVKAISPRDGLHTIYFIMVEILPNKKENLA